MSQVVSRVTFLSVVVKECLAWFKEAFKGRPALLRAAVESFTAALSRGASPSVAKEGKRLGILPVRGRMDEQAKDWLRLHSLYAAFVNAAQQGLFVLLMERAAQEVRGRTDAVYDESALHLFGELERLTRPSTFFLQEGKTRVRYTQKAHLGHTALALGEGFPKALGNARGAFSLYAADAVLALVARVRNFPRTKDKRRWFTRRMLSMMIGEGGRSLFSTLLSSFLCHTLRADYWSRLGQVAQRDEETAAAQEALLDLGDEFPRALKRVLRALRTAAREKAKVKIMGAAGREANRKAIEAQRKALRHEQALAAIGWVNYLPSSDEESEEGEDDLEGHRTFGDVDSETARGDMSNVLAEAEG